MQLLKSIRKLIIIIIIIASLNATTKHAIFEPEQEQKKKRGFRTGQTDKIGGPGVVVKVTLELLRAFNRARRAASCVDGGVVLLEGIGWVAGWVEFACFLFFYFLGGGRRFPSKKKKIEE